MARFAPRLPGTCAGMNTLAKGLVAGAAGTTALNSSTYLDMALRGRPPSSIPNQEAANLARQAHLPLGAGDTAEHRKEGIGALLGLATGVVWGVAYALLRTKVRLPVRVAGPVLAGAVIAGSDVPMVLQGLTDPRAWGVSGWLEDLVPHLVYGYVTAAALEMLDGRA